METRSRSWRDDEDWLAYLRDVIARPDAHPQLGAPAGLSTLEAEVRGSGHAARLADAALALLETGTDAERAAVQGLGLHAAPDAAPRLRALLARPALPAGARARCASELLEIAHDDPAALAALREALASFPASEASIAVPPSAARGDLIAAPDLRAGGPGDRRPALLGAARHLPEWPARWLGLAPPEAELLLELWTATPASRRRAFVDAVAAAGGVHLHALIAGARQLVRQSREQVAPLMKMLAPHLPDPTSGEIVVEAMVGSLRSNRKDPRQAELAEHILRKHDIWPRKPDDD